jgi:hypothetical protein
MLNWRISTRSAIVAGSSDRRAGGSRVGHLRGGNALVAYIHRRLRALTEGTRRVSGGDFSRPVAVGGGDEFGVLARTSTA